MSDVKRVHVIFKTHLDIGFTDYARDVVDQYVHNFIPAAIELVEQMLEEHPEELFSWTIGSWILKTFLDQAPDQLIARTESVIQRGLLNWLAVPFTTHTEIMNARLFKYGLELSAALDDRFSRTTIAAKMTDVPGHTRAMIPLMAEAGITFLHIGVNPAASVPDLPPVFLWHDPSTQNQIICMVQRVYGDTIILPGTDEALALVFTGDNHGPPSHDNVRATYRSLREQFPDAELMASDLNRVAASLTTVVDDLPIVSQEIGDTWIQGVGTDPTKVSQYRELLRLVETWHHSEEVSEGTLDAFYDHLLLIPEHTWGMDLKKHLRDYEQYDTEALKSARQLPDFKRFEASWSEQRAYINRALEALVARDPALHVQATDALAAIVPKAPDLSRFTQTNRTTFKSANHLLCLDERTGAIIALHDNHSGTTWADDTHPIALLRYETFSTADYERYWQQYIRDREFDELRIWAHPDNVKPGMQVEQHGQWYPQVQALYEYRDTNHLTVIVEATFSAEAHHIGAPEHIWLQYDFNADHQIDISLTWQNKPACRLAEAFWLTFNPIIAQSENWQIEKLNQWISPRDVVSRGGRTLHGFDRGVRCEDQGETLLIESLDAVLVAPGSPSLLDFHNRLPDLSGGMHFNLYNNVWGTNFPMWFEDDALFRFKWLIVDSSAR